jgi:hypothetical protein
MTHVNRTIGAALAAIAVGLFRGDDLRAQPGPPVITRVELNGGAETTTSDQVALAFSYEHPAAIGVPIPWYRIRKKSPDGTFPAWGVYEANYRRLNRFTVVLDRRNGVTPLPGPHTVELQLKDDLGQESAVASATITRVLPPPPPAQYPLTGADIGQAIALAETRGYGWFVTPANGNSGCVRKDGSLGTWLRAGAKAPGPVALSSVDPRAACLWRFMQHKPLRTGWRIARVEVKVGTDFTPCVAPNCSVTFGSQAGQGAGFTVSHRVPPFMGGVVQSTPPMYREAADATITTLVLEGPPGAQWQDAFVP